MPKPNFDVSIYHPGLFDIQDDTDDRVMVVNVHLALAANDIMVSSPQFYITGK